MSSQFSRIERVYAALLALAGWSAILLQCYWAIDTGIAKGLSLSMTIANVLSYFTILTNILVAGYLSAVASGTPVRSTSTGTALLNYILIVGVVYEVALRRLWNPEGLHLVVDVVLHYLVPLAYLTYWFLFIEKRTLNYRMVAAWTIYPFAYLFYTLIRGHFYGFFPYPFVNFQDTGWPRLLVNVCGLIALFVLTGALLVALGRLVVRTSDDYRTPKM